MVLFEIQYRKIAILIGLMLGVCDMGIVCFLLESNRALGEVEVFFYVFANYFLLAISGGIIYYGADKRERCLLHSETIQSIGYIFVLIESETPNTYFKLGIFHTLLSFDFSQQRVNHILNFFSFLNLRNFT